MAGMRRLRMSRMVVLLVVRGCGEWADGGGAS